MDSTKSPKVLSIVVFAGSYVIAREWAISKGLPTVELRRVQFNEELKVRWIYAPTFEKCFGLENVAYLRLYGWWKFKDMSHVEQYIDLHNWKLIYGYFTLEEIVDFLTKGLSPSR